MNWETQLYHIQFTGTIDRLGPVADPELAVNIVDMFLNGAERNKEIVRYGLIGLPVGQLV